MSNHHRRATCGYCGRAAHTKGDPRTFLCALCRHTDREAQPTDDDALPPGQWVKRGLTHVFVPSQPGLDNDEAELMDTLERNLTDPANQPPPAPTRTTGVLCPCGCLLEHPAESCPACLVWAERDAVRASWAAAVHHNPTTRTSKEEAA